MGERRTALIVAVPEAEALVGEHRSRLDPSARAGVPAHVTVLYPFVPADRLDADVVRRVGEVLFPQPAFDFALLRADWFGDEVLWLAPEPADRFRELTEAVHAAFPEHPPYRGRYPDAAPHLTVGITAVLPDLQAAERAVASGLPIRSTARAVLLIVEHESGTWDTAAAFALRPV